MVRALQTGKHWNFKYCIFWHPEEIAELCVKALAHNIESDYVCELIKLHGLMPEKLPLDIQAWPWPVSFSTFGGFSMRIYGELSVPKGKKAQKQPILLIKYLLARGGNNIPEHEIQDTLWPESDGDAAQNSYSTTLHRTRKLLSNKNALIHSNGRLSFNDTMVWTDTALFDHYLERIHSKINGLWIQKDPRKGNTSAVRLLEDLSACFQFTGGPFWLVIRRPGFCQGQKC